MIQNVGAIYKKYFGYTYEGLPF